MSAVLFARLMTAVGDYGQARQDELPESSQSWLESIQVLACQLQTDAYAEGRKDESEEVPEALAGRLIDIWCANSGKQIPWAKAVEITAVVTKMSDVERLRLLALEAV